MIIKVIWYNNQKEVMVLQKYNKCVSFLLLFLCVAITLYYYYYKITDDTYNWFFLAWLHVAVIFSSIHLFQSKTIKTILLCATASTLFFILSGIYAVLRTIDISLPYDGEAIFWYHFQGGVVFLALAVGMVLWAKRKYCSR